VARCEDADGKNIMGSALSTYQPLGLWAFAQSLQAKIRSLNDIYRSPDFLRFDWDRFVMKLLEHADDELKLLGFDGCNFLLTRWTAYAKAAVGWTRRRAANYRFFFSPKIAFQLSL
jgi:hypothetical protein